MRNFKFDCIGAGPGGLLFSILAKLSNPNSRVRVFEKNDINDLPGWGVVLDEDIRDHFAVADPVIYDAISKHLYYWNTIDVKYKNTCVSSSGYNFACISRKKLVTLLRERASELGVEFYFGQNIIDHHQLDADLIVAADGVESINRNKLQTTFKPLVKYSQNYYIWFGTKQIFKNFTFDVQKVKKGWVWMQAYQYDKAHSTFIAECDEEAFKYYNFANKSAENTIGLLNDLYSKPLQGHKLEALSSAKNILWRNFKHIKCERWHNNRLVLIGDAAHTAHYSVGSGTKMALLDAIVLAKHVFSSKQSLSEPLAKYEQERKPQVEAIQDQAYRSDKWFASLDEVSQLSSKQLGVSLLTRTHYNGTQIPENIINEFLQMNTLALAKKGGATSSSIGKKALSLLNLNISEY